MPGTCHMVSYGLQGAELCNRMPASFILLKLS
jgi:hypothetical protein